MPHAIVEAKHYDYGADVGVASDRTDATPICISEQLGKWLQQNQPASVPTHPSDNPLSTHAH